ncbi:MAG: AMP-binding protein, partial [Pseudomonadota bacterium]|nr:AMP-binding protein [Pseudomonadota bacterium]
MIDIRPPQPETPPTATVVDMIRASARENPGKEAVICGDTRMTWAQFDARVNRVAQTLIAMGVQK